MYKSNKRIKIEQEIYSKSIKDIEEMFNLSHLEQREVVDGLKKRKLPEVCLDQQENKHSSHDSNPKADIEIIRYENKPMNEGNGLNSFSPLRTHTEVQTPLGQKTYRLLSRSSFEEASLPNFNLKQNLLELYFDEDIDYYSICVDTKSYLPRLNLESDLKLIDQMFSKLLLSKPV